MEAVIETEGTDRETARMRCPHCKAKIEGGWDKVRKNRRRSGLCIGCKAPLTEVEITAKNVSCFLCRRHRSVIRSRWEQSRKAKAA